MTEKNLNQYKSLIEIVMTIVIPSLILTKSAKYGLLEPTWTLVLALVFPLGFALWTIVKEKKVHFFTIIGFVSILLTGGIGLFNIDSKWIAVKEALVPFIFGSVFLGSIITNHPILEWLIKQILDFDHIYNLMKEKNKVDYFEKKMKITTFFVSCSFFLSSFLNYVLAKWIVVSPSGTPAFNEELGTLTALSYPVIAVPSLIVLVGSLVYLVTSIQKFTDLKLEDLIRH